jgi:hypothetical protein
MLRCSFDNNDGDYSIIYILKKLVGLGTCNLSYTEGRDQEDLY